MPPLEEASLSLDANVVLDFHLTANYAVLETVTSGRMLLSDFVQEDLQRAGNTPLPAGSEVVSFTTETELAFFVDLGREYPRLGSGELGALTVAKFRSAYFVSNDKHARAAAQDLGLSMSGGLGLLHLAVVANYLDPQDAIRVMEEMILAGSWFSDELVEMFRNSVSTN